MRTTGSMSSIARHQLILPPAIARYFAADTGDASAVAGCFREDAVVVDEQRSHHGRADIARWKAEATAKYQYTSEPLSSVTCGQDTFVTARLTGNFPGSPVTLRYHFTLRDDTIALLEITT